jgi:hypothetical protein
VIGPDSVASVRPGKLLLRTGGACDLDPERLFDVFGEQRRRFGDGGGVFDLDSRGDVMLTVDRVTTAGAPAAEVADALAGRSQIAAALGDLPTNSRAALCTSPTSSNTSVEQSPT